MLAKELLSEIVASVHADGTNFYLGLKKVVNIGVMEKDEIYHLVGDEALNHDHVGRLV